MPYDTRSPSTVINYDTEINYIEWINLNNISYEDTMVASCSLNSGESSKFLIAKGFNFNIPRFASITGIKARIKSYSTGSIANNQISLSNDTNPIGLDMESYADPVLWGTESRYSIIGSSTETWGNTLTPDDINSADFGILIGVSSLQNSKSAYIDHIELIVYYTEGDTSMSTDVVKKVINSNSIKNGTAVATTSVKGEYDKVDPKINKEPSVDAMNTKYANKFDDSTYYA